MGLFGRDTQTQTPHPDQTQRVSSPGSRAESTTTIAQGTKVSGEISGSSDLRIDGKFEGSVAISGVVFVAETGHVRTSIRAARVTVAGQVDGDIFGDHLIELEPTAVVSGNLLAPKILIREGASLQGRVEMASPPPETPKDTARKTKARSRHARSKDHDRQNSAEPATKEPNGRRS